MNVTVYVFMKIANAVHVANEGCSSTSCRELYCQLHSAALSTAIF